MCLISFLPHILDDMEAGRKIKYKLLKSVAKDYRGKIDFVWIEGGAQPELEAAFNLGFGFPAAVLINCANHLPGTALLAADSTPQKVTRLTLGLTCETTVTLQIFRLRSQKTGLRRRHDRFRRARSQIVCRRVAYWAAKGGSVPKRWPPIDRRDG